MEADEQQMEYQKLLHVNRVLWQTNQQLRKDIKIFQSSIQQIQPDTTRLPVASVRNLADLPPLHRIMATGHCSFPRDIRVLQKSNAMLQHINKKLARDQTAIFSNLIELKKLNKVEKATQTQSRWQEMEQARKLPVQEKVWEAKKKELQEELSILKQQKYEVEERERRALRARDALQRAVHELKACGRLHAIQEMLDKT